MKIEIGNELYNYNGNIGDFTLYHGLNRLFNTRGLARQFYGPLSTTWEVTVARNFAGDSGMILQINNDTNFKNVNAIEVDWISCHDNEQEVLLLNPQVLIQKTYVFSKDYPENALLFKRTVLSTIHIHSNQHEKIFENLSAYLQSEWIPAILEYIVEDRNFVIQIDLFTPKEYLHEMNLLEFIFFECRQYQIATYIRDEYKTGKEISEMLIGSDFFKNDDIWTQSIDRSDRFCSKYQPGMCSMDVVYEYDNRETVQKTFGTKQGKQMLLNTNLILQYVDQRKLYELNNELTININMNIKYQHQYDDGDTICQILHLK